MFCANLFGDAALLAHIGERHSHENQLDMAAQQATFAERVQHLCWSVLLFESVQRRVEEKAMPLEVYLREAADGRLGVTVVKHPAISQTLEDNDVHLCTGTRVEPENRCAFYAVYFFEQLKELGIDDAVWAIVGDSQRRTRVPRNEPELRGCEMASGEIVKQLNTRFRSTAVKLQLRPSFAKWLGARSSSTRRRPCKHWRAQAIRRGSSITASQLERYGCAALSGARDG